MSRLSERLETAGLLEDWRGRRLLQVVSDETYLMPSGYPYIGEAAFLRFLQTIPHLFRDGLFVLDWLDQLGPILDQLPTSESESPARAARVLRTVVRTAAITAPSDLWLMRYVLGVHKHLGILDDLLTEVVLDPDSYAEAKGLNRRQLKVDLHFLAARGYLSFESPCFVAPLQPEMRRNLEVVGGVVDSGPRLAQWIAYFEGQGGLPEITWVGEPGPRARPGWVPTLTEVELGHQLLPVVLALASLGKGLDSLVPLPEPLQRLFEETGVLRESTLTELGERVFQRGPGPFGIIGAYYPYMENLQRSLTSQRPNVWVNRSKNVMASQQANSRTFQLANRALDSFSEDHDFVYTVFIEHAVGRGEATRQRFEACGEEQIRYFGADLEDAAIDEAVEQQRLGRLPQNMQFIRQADIGQPQLIIDHLREQGLSPRGAVMLVGNGFHEIREQTNQGMVNVFRAYEEAGIVLLFTEETGLTDTDLRATGWNTYHAGFRYVHELSGQGLRPSWDREYLQKVWSWRRCAQEAGYEILDQYTRGTRPIYPIKKKGRENPSISVTYFCLPRALQS